MTQAKDKRDRLLATQPFKHYRRRYSVEEAKGFALVVLGAVAISTWVYTRGQTRDEDLFKPSAQLARRDGSASAGRGPFPTGLAPAGFKEDKLSDYGKDNLYVKINGREGFYKAFGFEHLYFISFVEEGDETRTVDVELFDLGTQANASGCFQKEAPGDAEVLEKDLALVRVDKNAMFLAQNRFYARVLGSTADATMRGAVAAVTNALVGALPASEQPKSHRVFVDALALPTKGIRFEEKDAFSFSFGTNVHISTVPESNLELFFVETESDEAATALAAKFQAGFLELGEEVAAGARTVVKDRYLGELSGAGARGSIVYGARAATSTEEIANWLDKLEAAVGPPAGGATTDDAGPGPSADETGDDETGAASERETADEEDDGYAEGQ